MLHVVEAMVLMFISLFFAVCQPFSDMVLEAGNQMYSCLNETATTSLRDTFFVCRNTYTKANNRYIRPLNEGIELF